MAENLLSQSLGGTKKKRTVIVVKKLEKRSPKKEVFVSRKIKHGEDLEETFMGNSSAQKPVKCKDSDDVVSRSVLGDPKTFAMYEEHTEAGGSVDVPSGPPVSSRGGSRGGSRKTLARAASAEQKMSVKDSKKNKKVAMVTDSQNYVDSLKRLKATATKLRVKEREKEQNLLNYLPVNERFDLNKEGKVLAMWQERQKKWDQIQKGLSDKVGVRESNLLMSTGDDFRTRNEDYDLLQAAIPVHERFGSESWQMQLRGGTEKAVTIGHVFSGLTCNVSVKRTTPATLRKPKKSRGPGKTTQFIDAFPSMKLRQKQLKKTLQTLRPHSLETFDVDSLIIGSRDLYDWAINSSQDYMSELQNDMDEESGDELSPSNSLDNADGLAIVEPEPENTGPQLSFESSRNILLNALQNETTKTTVSFVNTGSTVMKYTWKKVAMNMDSELVSSFEKRNAVPREHDLSEKRPVFFCSCPEGQILPGQRVKTIFLFNSKGCGGYFKEAWMLDTSPRAIVLYPNRLMRTVSMDYPGGNTDGRTSAQPIPAAVYVKLKGHAATVDEYQHRRDESLNAISNGCIRSGIGDELYDSIRNVRKPITVSELDSRKVKLFKDLNSEAIISQCDCCQDESTVNISFLRFESFLKLAGEVSALSEKLYNIEKERIIEAGLDKSPSERICLNVPSKLQTLRNKLLPEGNIATFDEVSEDMLCFSWDLDLNRLSEEMDRLLVSSEAIKEYEKIIESNRLLEEKKRISAEKRAADSDYESDEDEEDEEDEDDENAAPKPEHELVLLSNQLKDHLRSLFHALSMSELPTIENQVRNAICLAIDGYEDIRTSVLDSLDSKGKFEPAPTPNPFSEEGVAFWDDLLIPPTDPAEITKRAKAGYDKDPKRKFYIDLFSKVSSAIVTSVADELTGVDSSMQSVVSNSIENNSSFADLPNVSALRMSDVENVVPNAPVFVGFNGDCFASEPIKSAFNFTQLERRLAVAPIMESAAGGAKKILLVHESNSPLYLDSVKAVGKLIQEVLTSEDAKLAERNNVEEGKLKNYTVISCGTIPEVMHMMQAPPAADGTVQVYYLDNLSSDKVVPVRREYVEELSDDDDAPIPMGLDEYLDLKKSKWAAAGPQKVVTNITANKKQNKVSCYTDAGYAIRELFQESSSLWVEASETALLSTPALSKVSEGRVLSSRIRDMLLWVGIMQNISSSHDLLSSHQEENLTESHSENSEKEPPVIDFSRHFARIFTPSETLYPRFIATIGGKLTPPKIKFLENIIDYVSTIFLCGEICIPFIACSNKCVTFRQYLQICSDYSSLCGMILHKAKLRGVEIILPDDVVTGDEELSTNQLLNCFSNVDDSSRDEGVDYDGESSIMSLKVDPGQTDMINVSGFIYDIGPSTCDVISAALASCQLHLSWGTAGCSEISSFQAGQRAIVTASSPPRPEEGSIQGDEVPQPTPRNIVIGESNVEWWARISDPEGEFEGHLTKMGVADFVTRHAVSICSLLCNEVSTSLSAVIRRTANSDEWDYLTALRHEDDEEEEEEEDEDDDDDED